MSDVDGLRFERVSIRAGEFVLQELDFVVPRGAYAILMGATGSGKTTILEATCGLRTISGGSIAIEGRSIETLAPADRLIGYVPQDSFLFSFVGTRILVDR